MKQFGAAAPKAKAKAKTNPKSSAKTTAAVPPVKSTPAAAPKASAAVTPTPKTSSAKQKNSANPTPDAEPPLKVPRVDQARIGRLKRKKDTPEDMQIGAPDMACDADILGEDSNVLCEADRAIMNGFDERFAALRTLEPPLADGAFKQYLTEVAGKLASMNSEVKSKKKSAYCDVPNMMPIHCISHFPHLATDLLHCNN